MTELVRAYAHGLFVSGHFNGDPHAGNLLVTRRGGKAHCVLLDWGLTKSLPPNRRKAAAELMVATGMKDTCGIVKAFKDMGMNFSGSIDPEPEMLLAILRHISLIERKAESRKIASNFGKTVSKLVENKVDLHSKVDSYTGDFFFIFRVATLIKGICAILDIRAQFLDIFVQVSREALRGPCCVLDSEANRRLQLQLTGFPPGYSTAEASLLRIAQEAIRSGGAVGVQVAKVASDGTLLLSMSCGTVAYTSWQQLGPNDRFPLGSPCVSRALIATATLRALQERGVTPQAATGGVWLNFPGPAGTSVARVAEGGGPWAKPPPKASTRFMADLDAIAAWLDHAPPLGAGGAGFAPWWPAAAHAASCAQLLRAAAAGGASNSNSNSYNKNNSNSNNNNSAGASAPGSSLGEAIRSLFHEAGVLASPASESPVQISKPILSLEAAEIEASQDSLLASLGAEEMQCMHLMDACLANHELVRGSKELPSGLAASAGGLATVLARALSSRSGGSCRTSCARLWKEVAAGDDLSCVRAGPQGEVLVVLLTCQWYDPEAGTLTAAGMLRLVPVGWDRGTSFHPTLPVCYVVNELSSEVSVFQFDRRLAEKLANSDSDSVSSEPTLRLVQTVRTIPDAFPGDMNTCGRISVHSAGNFVLVSNRGHDSITVFRIHHELAHAGMLSLAHLQHTRGATPRHFQMDASGQWLITANQDSNNIGVFRFNLATGSLDWTGNEYNVPSPNFVCSVTPRPETRVRTLRTATLSTPPGHTGITMASKL
ncbi:unnamed protein product [Polarella glacialis]|uniref:ABC1 atypical kinase-like domain-containing protein n=1 Tax=Polarella glacialis TaxID=89957 RepID=A0A813JA40_POLGL|nr:unnamed protein product [Polarella glacialis]